MSALSFCFGQLKNASFFVPGKLLELCWQVSFLFAQRKSPLHRQQPPTPLPLRLQYGSPKRRKTYEVSNQYDTSYDQLRWNSGGWRLTQSSLKDCDKRPLSENSQTNDQTQNFFG